MILSDLLQLKEQGTRGAKKNHAALLPRRRLHVVRRQIRQTTTRGAVAGAGLQDQVEVRGVGCMKLCCEGPLVQADPQNALYVRVTAENAASIVDALSTAAQTTSRRPIPTRRFSRNNCPSSSPTAASWIPNGSKATSRRTVTRLCIKRCTK